MHIVVKGLYYRQCFRIDTVLDQRNTVRDLRPIKRGILVCSVMLFDKRSVTLHTSSTEISSRMSMTSRAFCCLASFDDMFGST